MNAAQLTSTMSFIGGKPMLILRDHIEGRVKVFRGNEWIATVCPGHIMCVEQEAVLLSRGQPFEYEWRNNYGTIGYGLSVLQQTGDWDEADEAVDATYEF